jgi:hypothetical protein
MNAQSLMRAGLATMTLCAATAVASAADVRMYTRHEVADYATWKKVYDSVAPLQKQAGVYFKAVYRSAENPNDVTVVHDFHSLEAAKAFAASPDLRAAMEKGGVKGPPQIWFVTLRSK